VPLDPVHSHRIELVQRPKGTVWIPPAVGQIAEFFQFDGINIGVVHGFPSPGQSARRQLAAAACLHPTAPAVAQCWHEFAADGGAAKTRHK
jgi:hypothetical protein